jgi:SAM-dependent methyltransferase
MQSSARCADPEASTAASACRSCGGGDVRVFYEVRGVPVHSNQLHPTRERALAQAAANLAIGLCSGCGFVQNCAYDPSLQDYAESYEDNQGHSERFDRFATDLVEGLVRRHGLRGKRVLEIGCGRGDFLLRLRDAGLASGIGIDPAFRESEVSRAAGADFRFLAECYDARHAQLGGDLVFCRHTLEHIPQPREFVRLLRSNLADRPAAVYFEVPDAERILEERAFWDVYYEHCNYFTADSLSRLFRSSGFEILDVRTEFAGQYLLLEARPGRASEVPRLGRKEFASLAERAERFGRDVGETLSEWRVRLDAWRASGRRVALWGSGSKAVAFLCALHVADEVECVVDINPAKQGSYQAGTGHAVVAPGELSELRPDVVVAMNPIYREEIAGDLSARGVEAELHVL